MKEEIIFRIDGEISRLRLKPGDVVVVTANGGLSEASAEKVKAGLEAAFPGYVIIVLTGNMSVKTVRPA